MRARIILLVGLSIVGATALGYAADPGLEVATAWNASSLGGIQTCYAKVALRIIPAGDAEPSLEYSSEYWRGFPGQTIDAEIVQGRQRAITEQPGASATGEDCCAPLGWIHRGRTSGGACDDQPVARADAPGGATSP
jgi:hypothetical protein